MYKKYTSPLVSCIECRQEKSAKGIFSHYLISHTSDGHEKWIDKSIKGGNTVKNKYKFPTPSELNYINSPNKCVNCDTNITFDKRHNKFCSSSCSATFNNKNRDKDIYIKQKETLKITLDNKPKLIKPKVTKIAKVKKVEYCKFSYCVICCSTIKNKIVKTCSEKCYKTNLSIQAQNRQTHPQNGKTIIYNGIKLGSSYEYKVALSLDENYIKWIKPKPLKYVDIKGKIRNYFPDFFLPEYNVFLDPKNDFLIKHVNPETGFRDSDKIKWASEFNKVKIIILDKNQLTWKCIKDLL